MQRDCVEAFRLEPGVRLGFVADDSNVGRGGRGQRGKRPLPFPIQGHQPAPCGIIAICGRARCQFGGKGVGTGGGMETAARMRFVGWTLVIPFRIGETLPVRSTIAFSYLANPF